MKRRIITIFLLCFGLLLLADNELDLGDFVIEGEGLNLPDSLYEAEVADSLLKLNKIDQFEYINEPVIIDLEENNISESFSNSVIQVLAGNREIGSLSLESRNAKESWKNIGVRGYFQNREEDWERLDLKLLWNPEFKNNIIVVSPQFLDVQSVPGDTKAWGSTVSVESKYFGSGLIKHYSVELGYFDIEQQAQDVSDFDLETAFISNIGKIGFSTGFRLLKQTPSG